MIHSYQGSCHLIMQYRKTLMRDPCHLIRQFCWTLARDPCLLDRLLIGSQTRNHIHLSKRSGISPKEEHASRLGPNTKKSGYDSKRHEHFHKLKTLKVFCLSVSVFLAIVVPPHQSHSKTSKAKKVQA